MKLPTLQHARTVDCPADALPGTLGYVQRREKVGDVVRECYERAALVSVWGKHQRDVIVLLDSGKKSQIRRWSFRVPLIEHPIWQEIESVTEPNRVYVVCRKCNHTGRVVIGKEKAQGQAVTGVPCPKCGLHHLSRIKD